MHQSEDDSRLPRPRSTESGQAWNESAPPAPDAADAERWDASRIMASLRDAAQAAQAEASRLATQDEPPAEIPAKVCAPIPLMGFHQHVSCLMPCLHARLHCWDQHSLPQLSGLGLQSCARICSQLILRFPVLVRKLALPCGSALIQCKLWNLPEATPVDD